MPGGGSGVLSVTVEGRLVHKPPVDTSTSSARAATYLGSAQKLHVRVFDPCVLCPCVANERVCRRDTARRGGRGGGGGDGECLWQRNCWPLDTLLLLGGASPSH